MVVAMTCYFVAFSDYPSHQLRTHFGNCSHSWKTKVPVVVVKRIENVIENVAKGHTMKTIHAEELPWSSRSPTLAKLANVPHTQVGNLTAGNAWFSEFAFIRVVPYTPTIQ
jgi:hypothetical protein